MPDPWQVATWRFEQIGPLLDQATSRAEKSSYIRDRSAHPVQWPGPEGEAGRTRPIGRATLFRWVKAYQELGLLGLIPSKRRDKGQAKGDYSTVVTYALGLLYEQPERSLTQVMAYLRLEFPDVKITRSTLHRELSRHPAYEGICRRRSGKPKKLRNLYQVGQPHELWQMDAKGPFKVHLTSGQRAVVHVLSILEGFSRSILAAIVAPSESTAAAMRVTRLAMSKYGLASRYQMDRHSAYDSWDFRSALARLGVHRNHVKARNPQAQGLIEAYHKSLGRWFVNELTCQQVTSLEHLEQLLQATIDLLYNQHRHSVLRMSPADALAGRLSGRRVSECDLALALRLSHKGRSHANTGLIELPGAGTFRVPTRLAGQRALFRYEPHAGGQAVLVRADGDEIVLAPYTKLDPFAASPDPPQAGTGQLQKILDVWRGASRPNAQPGFGLPEVFAALEPLLGHRVPLDEQEATLIHRFYAELGPLPRQPFLHALEITQESLGAARPLKKYLDHLARQIRQSQAPHLPENPLP
jgi:transposase InsO family protein